MTQSHPLRCKFRVTGMKRIALLVVALLAFASTARAGEALRVLVSPVSADKAETSEVVAGYLRERLALCAGVDLVSGQRAGRIAGWLWGGAYDMSDAERWRRLRESVAIDVLIEIRAQTVGVSPGNAGSPSGEVTLYINDAMKKLKIETPASATAGRIDNTWSVAMANLGGAIAKELALSDADSKAMNATPIEETAPFQAYYRTLVGESYGAVDPLQTLSAAYAAKPHWAYDVATVRICAKQIGGVKRGGETSISKATIASGRKSLVRLLGTPHESEAEALVALNRSIVSAGPLDDFEAVLLEVAEPLMKGAKAGGAVEPAAAPGKGAKPEAKPAPGKKAPGRAPPPMQDAAKAAAKAKDADSPDEIDEIEAIAIPKKSGDTEAMKVPDAVASGTGKSEFTEEERAGALRLLGRMGSPSALAFIQQIVRRTDSGPREAAAIALAGYHEHDGLDVLKRLAEDADPSGSFLANRSLASRGQPAPGLRAAAMKVLVKPGRYREAACVSFASVAVAEDAAQLEAMLRDEKAAVRVAARRARLALGLIDAGNLALWLRDTDPATVLAAIRRAPAKPEGAVREALIRLTSEPDESLAWAARDALASSRPSEARARLVFDLTTAHHYLRQRAVERLTSMKEPWAIEELEAACANTEPHTRIAALRSLATAAPDRATGVLLKGLRDPHRLVRMETAALLGAAKLGASDAAAIRAVLSSERDDVTRLYLEEAAARAEGKPLPAPKPAAHAIPKDRNLAWMCGGANADSPYDAYYQMDAGVSAAWKKAHDAGKIFFARVSPIGNPGTVIFDPLAQDSIWLSLDTEIERADLPYIDGLVYGEETMSMSPGVLWHGGWRLFCAEVGIDEKRVAGNMNNLNVYEQRAWNHWAMTRVVEGFNRLYDVTKLRLGKLRPGIQVCTFMGEQSLMSSGPNVADFEWKFDVGGIYHYFGDSRKTAYALVRRYKTIWPERPVLWLSHGIGVYERTPIQYTHQAPTSPITAQGIRAYNDAATAWLAGADTGWFSIWAFLKWDWVNHGITSLKGPTIKPESIMSESKALESCVNYAFAGVEEMMRNKKDVAELGKKEIALPGTHDEKLADDFTTSLDAKPGDDPITAKLSADRRRMIVGFRYYGMFLYDLARVFGSLPRNNPKPDALVIQPGLNVWEGSLGDPGSDLLNSFDFLLDINKTPHLDLKRYRIIVAHDPGLLTDETIDAITRWLRETPGLLYVYCDLTADNASQASAPADFSGKLKRDWPWEADIATAAGVESPPKKGATWQVKGAMGELSLPDANAAKTYTIKNARATALLADGGSVVVAMWRHPDFKGAVVFDGVRGGGKVYRAALRDRMNELAKKDGIGRAIEGPIRSEVYSDERLTVAVAAGSPESLPIPGVDAITGRANPSVGPGGGASVVLRETQRRCVAAYNGVVVVCEKPGAKFERVEGGVRVTGGGLLRAVSERGGVEAKFEDGAAPKEIAANELSDWLVFGKADGIATVTLGKAPDAFNYVYVRSPKAVTFVPAARPSP